MTLRFFDITETGEIGDGNEELIATIKGATTPPESDSEIFVNDVQYIVDSVMSSYYDGDDKVTAEIFCIKTD